LTPPSLNPVGGPMFPLFLFDLDSANFTFGGGLPVLPQKETPHISRVRTFLSPSHATLLLFGVQPELLGIHCRLSLSPCSRGGSFSYLYICFSQENSEPLYRPSIKSTFFFSFFTLPPIFSRQPPSLRSTVSFSPSLIAQFPLCGVPGFCPPWTQQLIQWLSFPNFDHPPPTFSSLAPPFPSSSTCFTSSETTSEFFNSFLTPCVHQLLSSPPRRSEYRVSFLGC